MECCYPFSVFTVIVECRGLIERPAHIVAGQNATTVGGAMAVMRYITIPAWLFYLCDTHLIYCDTCRSQVLQSSGLPLTVSPPSDAVRQAACRSRMNADQPGNQTCTGCCWACYSCCSHITTIQSSTTRWQKLSARRPCSETSIGPHVHDM